MDNFDYHSPSAYLILQHKLGFQESNKIIERWLTDRPQESRQTLAKLLQSGKIIYKNDRLLDLPKLSSREADLLAKEIQEKQMLEIKDRRYKLKLYRQCFIGSELVDYLIKDKNITTAEAISLGQSLLERDLIYHVTNDHQFKNDYLFYRFKN